MVTAIFEILESTSKLKTEKERVHYLGQYADNSTLQTVLVGAYYDGVQWDLPLGIPPYKPCNPINAEGFLYTEVKRLHIFAKGGSNLTPLRRETLFIEFLENIHPKDALIIIDMKDKKLPYKNITKQLISKAFPGLIDPNEEV